MALLAGTKASQRRRTLGTGLLALAAGSAFLLLLVMTSPAPAPRLPPGPLQIAPSTTAYASISNVGQSHTYGELLLRNSGNEQARLTAASIVEEDPDLALLGVLAADPHELESLIGHAAEYPPSGSEESLHPLEGYVVPPGGDLNLLVGLQVLSPGTHLIRGIRLEYQVNEVSYMVTIPDSFRLCAPISEYASCEPISESIP